jgi:hypothetical protein
MKFSFEEMHSKLSPPIAFARKLWLEWTEGPGPASMLANERMIFHAGNKVLLSFCLINLASIVGNIVFLVRYSAHKPVFSMLIHLWVTSCVVEVAMAGSLLTRQKNSLNERAGVTLLLMTFVLAIFYAGLVSIYLGAYYRAYSYLTALSPLPFFFFYQRQIVLVIFGEAILFGAFFVVKKLSHLHLVPSVFPVEISELLYAQLNIISLIGLPASISFFWNRMASPNEQ